MPRTFTDLTEQEQQNAITICLNDLLDSVCEGLIRFNDEKNGNDLQSKIDAAGERANEMQTPWFIGEYVMDTCADDLRSIAEATAQDAIYLNESEHALHLPAA